MKEYIERAELYEAMNSQDCELSLIDALALIEEFPAADVVEVKNGRWIENTIRLEDGYIGEVFEETCYCCSNCNHETWDKIPYCPNCGARMDKEADHE